MFSSLATAPEFWVSVAFFGFIALLMWFNVPALLAKTLDARADAIRHELDEARRLRMEAQALLEDYRKKYGQAQNEAQSIVAEARREAEQIAIDARAAMTAQLERRQKSAEEKIARAEAQALGEVRVTAVEAAVEAARQLISEKLAPQVASGLIEAGIADVKRHLNG